MSRAERRRQQKLAKKQGRAPAAPGVDQAMAQAMQLHGQGNLAAAEGLYRKILQAQPDHVGALHLLGVVALQAGHPDEGVKLLERATQLPGVNPAAFVDLGKAYRETDRLDQAMAAFARAAELAPNIADAHANLGLGYLERGHYEQAAQTFERALKLRPTHAPDWIIYGQVLVALGRYPDALAAFQKAIEIRPNDAEAYSHAGNVQLKLSAPDQALDLLERALEIDPDSVNAHTTLGNALQELGQLEEAQASYRRAIELAPGLAAAHHNLATSAKWRERTADVDAMERAYAAAQSDADKMHLAFALGKVHEDLGENDRAFDFYREGNALKRATFDYATADDAAYLARMADIFTAAFLDAHADAGSADAAPVFIVGMPRSGTTLVEQILSAHPEVCGAGELYDLPLALAATFGDTQTHGFLDTLETCTDAALTAAGERYLDAVRRFDADARLITDKLPSNFQFIGVIKLLMPNAKVIHCRRDPMDTCLSIYRTWFAESGLTYAYDLEELGAYYNLYLDMMDHWNTVLPGFVHEVRYEDVVADLKGQTEGLLEFCGLPWDDACLDFHAAKRQVKTASAAQVRKPIYKSSLAAWKKFEEQLQPLKAVLDSRAG